MTYELIPAVGTQCACGEQPWLMCPERFDANLPAFYLCGFCGQVAQVGVGVVTRRLITAYSERATTRPADEKSGVGGPPLNPDR